jgi:hypothetical protein
MWHMTVKFRLTLDFNSVNESLAFILEDFGTGTDAHTDALEALIVASSDSKMDWSSSDKDSTAARIVVLVTSGAYHQKGDAAECQEAPFLENPGTAEFECFSQHYPSIEQVNVALNNKNIIPLVITSEYHIATYRDLLDQLDVRGEVIETSANSSIFLESTPFFEVIEKEIGEIVCVQPTPIPTTSTESTDTETTTSKTSTATESIGTETTPTTTTADVSQGGPCLEHPTLEVAFMVDNTGAINYYLDALRTTLPQLMKEFEAVYPGSRYGFGTFNEKDIQCKFFQFKSKQLFLFRRYWKVSIC